MNWYGILGTLVLILPAIAWIVYTWKKHGWRDVLAQMALWGVVFGVLLWFWAVNYLFQLSGWTK